MKNKLLYPIFHHINMLLVNYKWRRKNKHNKTNLVHNIKFSKIHIGNGTYGNLDVISFSTTNEKLVIGNYCSISNNVKFLLSGNHCYKTLSTFPFKRQITSPTTIESQSKGPIIIYDDVWIGYGSILLSGITIGQGAIIGAGSVVAKDIPPYAIFVGNDIIKYRFNKEIRNKLINIDFSKIKNKEIKDKIEYLYQEITEENIDKVLNNIFDD